MVIPGIADVAMARRIGQGDVYVYICICMCLDVILSEGSGIQKEYSDGHGRTRCLNISSSCTVDREPPANRDRKTRMAIFEQLGGWLSSKHTSSYADLKVMRHLEI